MLPPVRRTKGEPSASANAHEQAKNCSTKKSRTHHVMRQLLVAADAAGTTLAPASSSHLVRAAPVSADVAGRVLISYAERGQEPQVDHRRDRAHLHPRFAGTA